MLANALPSLLPLSPRGLPSWLVMRGFPNTGYLSNFAVLVGFDLLSPGLTVSQAPNILFQREAGGFFSLGAMNSQCMSWLQGPRLWTERRTRSTLCLRRSFQGSSPGARPLTRSFARRASDWVWGLMIPSPPLVVRRARVSHLTFALALVAFPPHM